MVVRAGPGTGIDGREQGSPVNARIRILAAVASLVLVAACGSATTVRLSPPAVGAATGTLPSATLSPVATSTGPLPSATAPATGSVDRVGAFAGGFWATQGTRLLISADGGTSWRPGTLPSPSPLAVDVLDASHAWAVYPVGATLTPVTGSPTDVMQLFVFRTSDGGTTWDATKLTENVADSIVVPAFRDAEHGYILASALRQSSGISTLLATSDGGATWAPAGQGAWLGAEFGTGPDGTLWAGSEPTAGPEQRPLLDVSRDGGQHWTDAGLPGLVGAAGARYSLLGPPSFVGMQGVVAVLDESGSGQVVRIFTSADGGRTWTRAADLSRSDVASFAVPLTFAAADPSHWLVGGLDGASLRVTSDAGRTWHDVATDGLPAGVTDLLFADATHGAAEVAPDNALYVTADGGMTWAPALLTPPAAASPAPGDWTGLRWSAPGVLPKGDARYATPDDVVAWAGGFVAVGFLRYGSGGAPAAWWSADGRSWTRTFTGPTRQVASMRWLMALPDRLVAIGTAGTQVCTGPGAGETRAPSPVRTWTSRDGRSWTQGPALGVFAGASIAGIAAGQGRIVAVGDTGFDHPAIWTSADGTTWTREALPAGTFGQAHFGVITLFAGGFVVAGGVGGIRPSNGGVAPSVASPPAIWVSADGRSWQRAILSGTTNAGQVETLAAGTAGLLAVGPTPSGYTAAVWTSVDGQTWSRLSDQRVLPGGSIASDGRRMIAQVYGSGDRVSFSASSDGTTWQPLVDTGATASMPRWPGQPNPTISAVRVTAGGLIVLGFDGRDGSSPIWIVPAVVGP